MNNYTIFSIVIAVITPMIGVYSVFKGEYKPQRMTRFLILILNGIIFTSLFLQNAGAGLYLAGIQFIGACIYFSLSFKYGMGGKSGLDIFILLSVIGIGGIWYITNNPLVALMLSIIVDFLAFIPTFKKTWQHPYTESWLFYGCDVLASCVNLMAISAIFTTSALFSWYVLVVNFIMVAIIIFKRNFYL